MAVGKNKERVPATLDRAVVQHIDAAVATGKYYSRSHWLNQAARAYANGVLKKERVRK